MCYFILKHRKDTAFCQMLSKRPRLVFVGCSDSGTRQKMVYRTKPIFESLKEEKGRIRYCCLELRGQGQSMDARFASASPQTDGVLSLAQWSTFLLMYLALSWRAAVVSSPSRWFQLLSSFLSTLPITKATPSSCDYT